MSVTIAGALPATAEEEIYSYNDSRRTEENSLETLEKFLVETAEQSRNLNQCMAFAKYCHSAFNDFEEYVYESICGDNSQVTLTTDNLYSYLKAIGGQSYVRGLTSNRTRHSVFIVVYTKDNVIIYNANYTSSNERDYCVVHNKDLTYSQFLSRIKYFQYAMTSEGDIINADEI